MHIYQSIKSEYHQKGSAGDMSLPQRCNIFIQCVMIATHANQRRWHRKWTLPTRKGNVEEPRWGPRPAKCIFTPWRHLHRPLRVKRKGTALTGACRCWLSLSGLNCPPETTPAVKPTVSERVVGTVILPGRPVFGGEVVIGMWVRWWRCSWRMEMQHTTRVQSTADISRRRLSATGTAAIISPDCQVRGGFPARELSSNYQESYALMCRDGGKSNQRYLHVVHLKGGCWNRLSW